MDLLGSIYWTQGLSHFQSNLIDSKFMNSNRTACPWQHAARTLARSSKEKIWKRRFEKNLKISDRWYHQKKLNRILYLLLTYCNCEGTECTTQKRDIEQQKHEVKNTTHKHTQTNKHTNEFIKRIKQTHEQIELNWIELNWIESNWIELNWIESYREVFVIFNHLHHHCRCHPHHIIN